MRQQTPPTDRIHAVIREGGERASVIPDHARLDLYVRSQRPQTLPDLSQRVEDVARGAALMAGVGVSVHWDEHPPSLPVRTNEALTGRWVRSQRRRGRDPLPHRRRLSLARGIHRLRQRQLPRARHPSGDPDRPVRGRAAHPGVRGLRGRRERLRTAAADGAYGLAATVLDVLHDPALAAAVTEEFEAAGGAIDVPGFFD